jgi:hypothetical protein
VRLSRIRHSSAHRVTVDSPAINSITIAAIWR